MYGRRWLPAGLLAVVTCRHALHTSCHHRSPVSKWRKHWLHISNSAYDQATCSAGAEHTYTQTYEPMENNAVQAQHHKHEGLS